MNWNEVWTPRAALEFWLAFSRLGSLLLPLGLPSAANASSTARLALAGALTVGLSSDWWRPNWDGSGGVWAFSGEMAVGMLIGLSANSVLEALFFAMHMVGVQSGYQYASTVDPTSQADSPVLPVMGQLLGLSLFFALGGDHYFVRALARSFAIWPVGSVVAPNFTVAALTQGGTMILETAVRFALPLIALLLVVDLTLGVFTRAHAQLQLISIAFPLKMLLALFTMVALLPIWTHLFSQRLAALNTMTVISGNR